jgi:anti-sigma-K factor RskA
MNGHDEMLDNVAAFALGVLTANEASVVAEHIRTCEECRNEYALLRPAVTAVAYSAEIPESQDRSSILLKARLMKQVRSEGGGKTHRSVWPVYVAAACLVVAILTGLMNLSLFRGLQNERARATAYAQTIADLSAPDAKRYAFGNGVVLTRGDHLYIALPDLPAPPSGKVYQAWTLPHGSATMAPSITFEPNGNETVIRLPQSAADVGVVAVSVEPAGGSKHPTTKPIAVAKI